MTVGTATTLSVIAALGAAGCKCGSEATKPAAKGAQAEGAPASADSDREEGWYRAFLSGDDEEEQMPFFLKLPRATGSAIVASGEQRIEAKHRWDGSDVVVEFEMYHTRLTATAGADGSLSGRFASRSKSWGEASLTFRAQPIDRPEPILFPGDPPAPGTSAAGVWKLEFADDSGTGKLVIDGDGPGLHGTLFFATGNIIYLAGNLRGTELRMSAFDGSGPYLLTGEIAGDEIKGRWNAGQALAWKESFQGARSGDFPIEPEVRVSPESPRLELAELDSPRYRDKPVIVELAGSWCPACKHAAPFLVGLYERYQPHGLEILTLTYEFTDDEGYNRRQAELFKREYGVEWEVVPVDGTLDVYWDIMPKELEDVNPGGFPVAIFVNRDRTIAGVHAGFPNPASAESYRETTERYEALVARILAGP